MRIVFFGTAGIACPVLRRLHESESHEVVGVISQPDRKQGRKQVLAPSPLRAEAIQLGIPSWTPEKVSSPEVMDLLEELQPEVNVVVAYGQYIPSRVTEFPLFRSVNVHPSKLPAYRGAAPVQWSIADGVVESAVTILYVSKKMDAGDLIAQAPVMISPEDTTESLFARMAEEGATLLVEALEKIQDPDFKSMPQDDSLATHARKLTKADRYPDWNASAETVRNWIRACHPWPGTVVEAEVLGKDPIKILAAEIVEVTGDPGTVLLENEAGPVVACGARGLVLTQVQPPGKRAMSGADFLRGLR